MIVVATDAPLDARDLKRLAARAIFAMARTGSTFSNGSGDFAIAFSTHPSLRVGHRQHAAAEDGAADRCGLGPVRGGARRDRGSDLQLTVAGRRHRRQRANDPGAAARRVEGAAEEVRPVVSRLEVRRAR